MWMNQNFLLAEDIECPNAPLEVCFMSLRDGGQLSIRMNMNGEVMLFYVIDKIKLNLKNCFYRCKLIRNLHRGQMSIIFVLFPCKSNPN